MLVLFFIKFEKPFTPETTKFVFEISTWVFITGIFGAVANSNFRWVSKTIQELNVEWNANEIIFFEIRTSGSSFLP
mgnify:CR=1 FL=1